MNYGPNGNFVKTPGDYSVPDGSAPYYKQESLLNKPNFTTQTRGPSGIINGPYDYPIFNYGQGPQLLNTMNNLMNTSVQTLTSDPILRKPTVNNPMMNVMPLDYDTEPFYEGNYQLSRNGEASGIKKEMKNDFDAGLFQDSDSLLWNRMNSQRQFYPTSVNSVPNNQGEFSQWLYGNSGECKSSSIYMKRGVKYTDGSLHCNGYNAAEPTNFGLLNGNLMSSVEQ